MEQHRVALPNDHTTCGLPAWHPVGVGVNFDPTNWLRRPGSDEADVGDQVADGPAKQRTKEENAKDREQP